MIQFKDRGDASRCIAGNAYAFCWDQSGWPPQVFCPGGQGNSATRWEEAMKNTDLTEQWSAMQRMFLPTAAISTTLRENARRFWENQEKALDSMQAFANGWFERRHTGAHTAREAAERMCGTETFFDLIQAYQDWASGALERIMADGLSCQQQMMAVTGALASPPLAPSASEKEAEPARSEAKTPARSKTA